jgi:hypothetical protein
MRSILGTMIRVLRSLNGTEEVLRALRDTDRRRRGDTLRLGNAIRYAQADPTDVCALAEYSRVANIARLLATCSVECQPFVRIGGGFAGG